MARPSPISIAPTINAIIPAFASAVAGSLPALGVPLRGLAATVAYSRVHTGVHYPGDVIVGSLMGTSIGEATALVVRGVRRRRSASRVETR